MSFDNLDSKEPLPPFRQPLDKDNGGSTGKLENTADKGHHHSKEILSSGLDGGHNVDMTNVVPTRGHHHHHHHHRQGSVSSNSDIYPMENIEFEIGGRSSEISNPMYSNRNPDQDQSFGRIDGGGKQIRDTFVRKLLFMKMLFWAIALHIVYITVFYYLYYGGIVLPFNYYSFGEAGPIYAEVVAVVCYIVLDIALNDAYSAFVGCLLSSKSGYSIAACGFSHATLIGKSSYASFLSFRSPIKQILSRISVFFVLHTAMIFVAILASTAVHAEKTRINQGSLMCLEYSQDGKAPIDRGIPSIYSEMGVSQMVDGTALGTLRRSDSTGLIEKSTNIIPPQLISPCLDGSTIIGRGFSTQVKTRCQCSVSSQTKDMINLGIKAQVANAVNPLVKSMKKTTGWVTFLEYQDQAITVTSILQGLRVCGGKNGSFPSVPICITTIDDHRIATVGVEYKTDGTPASIAAKTVKLVELKHPANMDWLNSSFHNLFGGKLSSHTLPASWPGSINPLLWHSSKDMRDSSLGFFDEGVEAAMVLLVRAAVQRTYTVSGALCLENVIDMSSLTLIISSYGFYLGIAWVVFQFSAIAMCLFAYIPWLYLSTPIYPAVQAAHDSIIFALLASKNAVTSQRLKAMSSNIEKDQIWPKLDIVLRVGESVLTAEDPERGVVLMDKPKMVTDMSFNKVYL